MKHESASYAVDVLMTEHRQIERVLLVLHEAVASAVARSASPDPELIGAIAHFLERFADGRHHEKEEKVLFAEMNARGFNSSMGPLACMVKQHESGRALVAVLRSWAESDPKGREWRLGAMVRAAFDYVELLSTHISVEDSAIFPAALAKLPHDSLLKVGVAYGNIDPPSWREELIAAVDDLVNMRQRAPAAAVLSGERR